MRTLLLFLFLLLGSSVMAREFVAAGKTHTAMGDYEISTCDQPCVINGETLKTFTVMYEHSPMSVRIAVRKNGKNTEYIVLSEKVSVIYVQTKRYFGVDGVLEDKGLNKDEYYHQKILTTRQSEKESLRLISAYFPYLLKEG